jgi:hypothetical protein
VPTRRFDVVSDDQATVVTGDFAAMSQFIYRRNLSNGSGIVGLFVSNGKTGVGGTSSSLSGTVSKAVIAEAKDAQVNIGISASGAGTGKGASPILNIGVEGFADILNTEGNFTNIAVAGTATKFIDKPNNTSVSVAIYGNAGNKPSQNSDPDITTNVNSGVLWAGYFLGDVGVTGKVYSQSDRKFKTQIKPLSSNNLTKLMQLKPSSYYYNDSRESKLFGLNQKTLQSGFIAQELEQVFPSLVQDKIAPILTGSANNPVEKVNYKAVNYIGLIPYMVAATQEQQTLITSLQTLTTSLQEKVANLESKQVQNNSPTSTKIGVTGSLEFLDISPNPTDGLTTITVSNKGIVNGMLFMVMDLNGKVMEEYMFEQNETSHILNATQWPKSMYIATYSANGAKPVTRTFVVK